MTRYEDKPQTFARFDKPQTFAPQAGFLPDSRLDFRPDSRPAEEWVPPPDEYEEAVTTEEIVFTGARYAIYGGVGYLVADNWLNGRGLLGIGIGLATGWLAEMTVGQYLLEGDGK